MEVWFASASLFLQEVLPQLHWPERANHMSSGRGRKLSQANQRPLRASLWEIEGEEYPYVDFVSQAPSVEPEAWW